MVRSSTSRALDVLLADVLGGEERERRRVARYELDRITDHGRVGQVVDIEDEVVARRAQHPDALVKRPKLLGYDVLAADRADGTAPEYEVLEDRAVAKGILRALALGP
jgi:hypothetical protein